MDQVFRQAGQDEIGVWLVGSGKTLNDADFGIIPAGIAGIQLTGLSH